MSTPHDLQHGALRVLIEHLDAVHGEVISDDLRDLRIPAVLRPQRDECVHPVTGETVEIETDAFQILVPRAFWEISHEVLEVTHMRQEGTATTTEILAAMQTTSAPVPADLIGDGAPFLRRCGVIGRWLFRLGCLVILVGFASMVLRLLGGW